VVVHRCTRLCNNHTIHVTFTVIIDFLASFFICCLVHGFQILLLYIMSCLLTCTFERCNVKVILLGYYTFRDASFMLEYAGCLHSATKLCIFGNAGSNYIETNV